jgi:flagellar protein FlaJ
MSFPSLALAIFGKIADKYSTSFEFLKHILPKADIKTPLKTYLSIMFFAIILSYLTTLAFTIYLVLYILKLPPLLATAFLLFIPFLVAAGIFLWFIFYPFQRSMIRRRNIEANLPFVITHMSSIAEAGIPPSAIFHLISAFKEYGEVTKELSKIARNVEEFGMDPVRAIREVANRTPSEKLRELLLGIVTTTESGGDIKLFLKNMGEQALFEWRLRRERFLQQMSTYAEFYVGIIIAAPLFLIALFAIMSLIQPNIGGFSIMDITKLAIYLIIPAINIGFLAFLRTIEVEI